MTAIKKTLIFYLFVLIAAASAETRLPEEQVYSLYSKANESFRQANSATDPDQAKRLYEKAILTFEKILSEGQIENAKLYYNLANAYLLSGSLGKAILNYRRAVIIDDSDKNIQKNLAFARSKRVDKIEEKTEERVLQTLFFWHYDFPFKTKFLLACIFWGVACISLTAIVLFGRHTALNLSVIICSILTLCFLTSVVIEHRTRIKKVCGVITSKDVIARQGDGINYPASFKEPLHEGTEFDLLEKRPGWFHIKLSDYSDAWIPDNTADLI